MRLVVDDAAISAVVESTRKWSIPSVRSSPKPAVAEQLRSIGVGVADKVVIKGREPRSLEAESAVVRVGRDAIPAGVIFRDQEDIRLDHSQRPAPLAEELLTEEIGVTNPGLG